MRSGPKARKCALMGFQPWDSTHGNPARWAGLSTWAPLARRRGAGFHPCHPPTADPCHCGRGGMPLPPRTPATPPAGDGSPAGGGCHSRRGGMALRPVQDGSPADAPRLFPQPGMALRRADAGPSSRTDAVPHVLLLCDFLVFREALLRAGGARACEAPVVATALWAVCARPTRRASNYARSAACTTRPNGPQGRGYNRMRLRCAG